MTARPARQELRAFALVAFQDDPVPPIVADRAERLLDAHEAAARSPLLALIADFVDPDPCWFDHHGYCQAHGWFETDPKCPHARAKEVLDQHPTTGKEK